MNDDQLMLEAAKGNRAAMELLVLRHYDDVYAFATRRTGSVQAAQDIAQTTFENLVRSVGAYRPLGRFRAFLFTIAANEVRAYFRNRPNTSVPQDEISDGGDGIRLLMRREDYRCVRAALNELPAAQQEALILFYYHDMSIKDVARVTGSNENTVKSRLRLALEKLRGRLRGELDEQEFV